MFKIEITEIVDKEQRVGKDWEVIGEEYKEGDERPTKKYGYTPEITKMKTVERVVLMQHVDEMDLGEVIKAINDL